MSAPPSDGELVAALEAGPAAGRVLSLERLPYRYATSAPLEEVRATTETGELSLILKDLDRGRLLGDAEAAKPRFLHEPRREIECYRRILAPAAIGPRLLGSATAGSGSWLLIEKVPGVELWQIGELAVWEAVARWLGALHGRFAGRARDLQAADPHLIELSEAWFGFWRERAAEALRSSGDSRAPALAGALAGYGTVAEALTALPATLVHGELYPSNVIVAGPRRTPRVCPVDWEMAGVGPGLIDLAALAGGWPRPERARLLDAYLEGLASSGAEAPAREAAATDLDRCRLHLALQWLGWARDWRPPAEHAHDWLGEAAALATDLGLR